MSGEFYDAPNQQVVRADGSAPWDEGTGGEAGDLPTAQAQEAEQPKETEQQPEPEPQQQPQPEPAQADPEPPPRRSRGK